MKKIISLLAAVSLFSTMLVANVSAAYEDVVTMDATKTSITVAEYNEATEESVDADAYDAYKVTVKLGNIGTVNSVVSGSGPRAKYSGRQIVAVNYKITFDDTSAMNKTNYALSMDSVLYPAFGPADAQKWDGNTYVAAPTQPFPGLTAAEYDNEIADALTFYFAIEKGKTANATITAYEVGLQNYTNSAPNAGESVEGHSNVNGNITANGFTIGEAASVATLDRVEITGDTTGLKMGATETTTLTATAYNNDNAVNEAATITWSVDNDVVTVDNGVVTAKKAGTATVTAKAVDGAIEKTASVVITVAEADPIVVTPSINVIGPDGEPVADITAALGTAATGTVGGKEVKGFVWPLVKLINFNAAGTYRATFTADDSKTAERTFDFSGIETIGKTDIEFAIVLNTNKTGVKLNMQYVAPSAE